MNFCQRVRSVQRKNRSLVCVGLDTDLNRIPPFLRTHENPIFEFNRRIIEATKDLVCAYKLNLAFYEALAENAWYTVHQTLAAIPEEIITIGDAKRGDIGNSSEMYAKHLIDDYEFTSTTVNPYMGFDSVAPCGADPCMSMWSERRASGIPERTVVWSLEPHGRQRYSVCGNSHPNCHS
jgi:orotidine-5'-phosphate decarboxylase